MYAYEIAYREALIAKGISLAEEHQRMREIYEIGKAYRDSQVEAVGEIK